MIFFLIEACFLMATTALVKLGGAVSHGRRLIGV